jgi:glycosyltransferase involved in cell wall biosynthesis
VEFLGTMKHDDVFEWLDTIDIYAQPSRQEGLPRALIEAMSRGVPTFGTQTGGIPELLEPKFIFSNTRRNIREICNILQSLDQDTMKVQAQRNFEESKKYETDAIEDRRNRFFLEFLNTITS